MASPDKKVVGARLRAAREAPPYWSRAKMAQRLREAAAPGDRAALPSPESLTDMIKQWEAGKFIPRPDYRALYAKATGRTAHDLFGDDYTPAPTGCWPRDGLTPDDAERLTLTALRPARLDAAVLDALATVLAGQRRLEDALGAAALLAPVSTQRNILTTTLKGTEGPLRTRLGRIVAEWTVYAGWLNAALRRDTQAVALFGDGEEIADEFGDGTLAALATSFRGYVDPAAGSSPRGGAGFHGGSGHPGRPSRPSDVRPAAGRPGLVRRAGGSRPFAAALQAEGLNGIPSDQADAEWLGEYRDALTTARDRS